MADESLDFRLTATDLASSKFAGVSKQLGTMHGAADQASGGLKGFASNALAAGKQSILMGVGLGSGLAAFQAVSAAARAAVGYLGDAVGAASDFNESQSKAKIVFGASSREIESWASKASTNMGMSAQAALEAAGTFGNLFTAMEIAVPAAKDMSKGIVKLASDLASFNNASPEDVLIALRAGLVGETEPLRKFGINLNAAAIAAEAVKLGLAQTTTAVSTGAKAQAAYSLIMQQSTTAQGDFERTSDGLANTQRTLEAQMADLSVEVGQALLPVLVELAQFARDDLIPAIREVGKVIGDVAGFIGDVGRAWDTVGLNFGAMGNRIHKIADATGATFDEVKNRIAYRMRENGLTFRQAAKEAEESFRRGSDAYVAAVTTMENKPVARLRSMEEIKAIVAAGTKDVADEMGGLVPKMANAMLADQKALTDAVTQLVTFMEQALSPAQVLATAQGFLTSKAYRDGMMSDKPIVVQKTIELRNAALAAIDGTGLSAQVAWNGGAAIINAWVGSMEYTLSTRLAHYNLMVSRYADVLGGSLPTAGPLQHPERGGKSIAEAWMGGLQKGLGPLNLPTLPGVGGMPAASVGGLTLAAAGGGGGSTTIVNFNSTWPPTLEQARELAAIVTREQYYGQSGASRFPKG